MVTRTADDLAILANEAADDVMEWADLEGQPEVRSLLDLVVNVILHRAQDSKAEVEEVIAACYDEGPREIDSWIEPLRW